MATITTPITKMFGIKHPVLLAGMNVAAGYVDTLRVRFCLSDTSLDLNS